MIDVKLMKANVICVGQTALGLCFFLQSILIASDVARKEHVFFGQITNSIVLACCGSNRLYAWLFSKLPTLSC